MIVQCFESWAIAGIEDDHLRMWTSKGLHQSPPPSAVGVGEGNFDGDGAAEVYASPDPPVCLGKTL